jgi:hypothetical protein
MQLLKVPVYYSFSFKRRMQLGVLNGATAFLSMRYRFANISIIVTFTPNLCSIHAFTISIAQSTLYFDAEFQLGHWVMFDNVNFCSPSVRLFMNSSFQAVFFHSSTSKII